MTTHWYLIEGINPQPWTSPEGAIKRVGGKAIVTQYKREELRTYQAAIEEAIKPVAVHMGDDTQLGFDVWFWRQIESYRNDNDRLVVKHRADRSNLLKALEDPLQGHLFKNDVQIKGGGAWIVEQSREIQPAILFRVYPIDHRYYKGIGAGVHWHPLLQHVAIDGVGHLALEAE